MYLGYLMQIVGSLLVDHWDILYGTLRWIMLWLKVSRGMTFKKSFMYIFDDWLCSLKCIGHRYVRDGGVFLPFSLCVLLLYYCWRYSKMTMLLVNCLLAAINIHIYIHTNKYTKNIFCNRCYLGHIFTQLRIGSTKHVQVLQKQNLFT